MDDSGEARTSKNEGPPQNSPRWSSVEKMLKVGATFDYGSRPLLQIALYAFEKWSPDLHPHALFGPAVGGPAGVSDSSSVGAVASPQQPSESTHAMTPQKKPRASEGLGGGENLAAGSPPARIAASADSRRLLHHYVSAPLQMPQDMIGGQIGHEFVAPMKALSPVEPKSKRDGLREVAGVGGGELVVGHDRTITER